jgi:hypothetical protein
MLRGDLGDLRIANEKDLQLPYILEGRAFEEHVPLSIEAIPTKRGSHETLSRYRLGARDSLRGQPLPLPIRGLELQFSEPFFSRPVRVLAPPRGRAREHERVLLTGILSRGAFDTSPIVLPLGGFPEAELGLEIDEGDNAPLAMPQARGIVDVPRVVFKGDRGTYRILLGNRRAETPRYDIGSLKQDVLAYSALVTPAGPLEANPAFKRGLGDYFADTSNTPLLWITLVIAVLALLALARRIVQQPEPPAP